MTLCSYVWLYAIIYIYRFVNVADSNGNLLMINITYAVICSYMMLYVVICGHMMIDDDYYLTTTTTNYC